MKINTSAYNRYYKIVCGGIFFEGKMENTGDLFGNSFDCRDFIGGTCRK